MRDTTRLTLLDVARSHARARPDGVALVDGDVRVTWRELLERVARLAHALRAAGVGPGDRVLWLAQNSFRLQELLLACCGLGAACCPANWRQQPEELAFVIDDLAPAVVITQETEIGPAAQEAMARATHVPARVVVHDADGTDSYEALVASAPPGAGDPEGDTDADVPLLLVYTAAFTGQPNAAMLASRALVAQGLLMAPMQGFDAQTVFLDSGPLFHIGTFMPNLSTFVAGGTNVFVRRSDGDAVARAIHEHRCTSGFLVGVMVDAVAAANAGGHYDLSCFSGQRGHAAFDVMVAPDRSPWGRHPGGYGQSEVMGMATFNLLGVGGLGTHGRPSPLVQLRVVDPDDQELPPGETGEIAIRGVTVMEGYWNRPELDAERHRGGWHHTHDLGRYESDGTFSFVGPKTRMIKSAAENIYPAEVEACLRTHPAVHDVAVIGVPDATWVQSVKAIVVLREGIAASETDLIEHCRARIASYKKPRTVELVEALPRAGSGAGSRVDYDALDARFGGGGYPGGTTRSA